MNALLLISALIALIPLAVNCMKAEPPSDSAISSASHVQNKNSFSGTGINLKKDRTQERYDGNFNKKWNLAEINASQDRRKANAIATAMNGAGIARLQAKGKTENVGGNIWSGPGFDQAVKRVNKQKLGSEAQLSEIWKNMNTWKGGSVRSSQGQAVAVNTEEGNDRKVKLAANGLGGKLKGKRNYLDVLAKACANNPSASACKSFSASNAEQGGHKVVPGKALNNGLQGQIFSDFPAKGRRSQQGEERKFNYRVECTGERRKGKCTRGQTQATLTEIGGDLDWSCTAQKTGDNVCVSKTLGKRSPVVTVDEDGFVTIRRNKVKVASGKCTKVKGSLKGSDRIVEDYTCDIGSVTKSNVGVSEMRATSGAQCSAQSQKNKNVKVTDIQVTPTTRKFPNGSTEYVFPGCFEVSANLHILNLNDADRVNFAQRLAWEFHVSILPWGKLNCRDTERCTVPGKDSSCYYCNLCKNGNGGRKHVKDNTVIDSCSTKKWARKQRISTTVCPPPAESTDQACYYANKLGDYPLKKGDVDVRLQVYLQHPSKKGQVPTRREELYNDWVKLANPRGNIIQKGRFQLRRLPSVADQKLNQQQLINSVKGGNLNVQSLLSSEDFKLVPFDIKRQMASDDQDIRGEEKYCAAWSNKYSAAGKGLDPALLAEGASILLSAKDYRKWLASSDCPKVEQYERGVYAADLRNLN